MGDSTSLRGYRFGERRRSGLFGSIPPSLALVGGTALVAAWMAIAGYVPIPVCVAAVLVCGWLWFGKVRARPAHEILPVLAMWWWRRLRSRNRWYRPVALIADGEQPASLPPELSGIDLFEVDVEWPTVGHVGPLGVVRDRQAGTLTAVLRVGGDGQFGLADPAGQDLRIDEWGSAIAGFAREHSPVVRVTFHDWSSPAPIRDSVARLESTWADEAEHPARSSYLQLLRETSATVIDHEVLVEVTVDMSRLGKSRGERKLAAGIRSVTEQTRLFAGRLGTSGLRVESVLSAPDLVTAMRVRSDPSAAEHLATLTHSLAAATGSSAPTFGPMHVDERLGSVVVDGAWHRSWWFSRWPRREVGGSWLDSLVFDSACTRTFTTVFEPVAPSRSDDDVDRERTQREANIETRRRKGFIVRRTDEKAVAEVESREIELAAGYVECLFTGLLTLTAPTAELLNQQSSDLEQVAANAGIELQPLWGRQGAGWVASLPLGRTLARRLGGR
ncbi:MAG: SCO6880 family protein [Ilumatobacter sp.]